jgi:hypothetical protein
MYDAMQEIRIPMHGIKIHILTEQKVGKQSCCYALLFCNIDTRFEQLEIQEKEIQEINEQDAGLSSML